MRPAGWRCLDTPPAPGADNMGMDEALMESVRAGGPPVLRFYRWSPACLSLGRNQPAAGLYREESLRELGIDVVRRPTGGRAVLHDHELTYSAVFPEGALGSPRTAYRRINRALVDGLRRLGVTAELQPRPGRRSPPPSVSPCFRDPAEGEVVVGGRKLIGSAQFREGGVVLQHGSLLLSGAQELASDLLARPATRRDGSAAVLADHLRPLPSWNVLTRALLDGWADGIGAAVLEATPSAPERARARELSGSYRDLAWTWRR